MPVAPTSSALVISQGSLLLTRHTEVTPQRSQARVMWATCSQVREPCSVSSHMPSKPDCPM